MPPGFSAGVAEIHQPAVDKQSWEPTPAVRSRGGGMDGHGRVISTQQSTLDGDFLLPRELLVREIQPCKNIISSELLFSTVTLRIIEISHWLTEICDFCAGVNTKEASRI